MSDSPTAPIAPARSSSDRVVAISHGAVLVIAGAIGLLDVLASGLFAPYVSGAVGLPLVLLAIGFIRHVRGGREGRALMAVADIAILAIVAVALVQVGDSYFGVVWRIGPLVLGGVTVLALATIPRATQTGIPTRVRRSGWHPIGVAILLAAGILPTVATFATMAGQYPVGVALSVTVPSIVGATVLAVAWWYGAGWLLGISSIGNLGYAASLAMLVGPTAGIQTALEGGLGFVLAIRGPQVAGATVPLRARAHDGAAASRPAVAWALVGAILLVPGVLGGLYLRYLFCSDCGTSPQVFPPILDAVLGAIVLALAVFLTVRTRARRPVPRVVAWLGFIGSVALLVQAMLGIVGLWGFDGMSVAGPAATLAAVGFAATIRAPAWLQGVGSWSAVAWALIAMVWMDRAGIALPSYFNLWVFRLSTLVTGALILVALAREATIRLDQVPDAAGGPMDDVPEPVEPVETESLSGTIRRR